MVKMGNSLVVWWLGFCIFTAEGVGSIPGQGIKIPQWQGQKYGLNSKYISKGLRRQEYWLDWFAVSFSRGAYWPKDRTQGTCTTGGLYPWATQSLCHHDKRKRENSASEK